MEQEEDALSDDSSASEENELQKQAEELQTVVRHAFQLTHTQTFYRMRLCPPSPLLFFHTF